MVVFEKTHIEKEAKQNKKLVISFPFVGDVKTIDRLEPSCGCTGVTKHKDRIDVYYNSGDIPIHLLFQGWYETTKEVDVIFVDGSLKTLKITIKTIK